MPKPPRNAVRQSDVELPAMKRFSVTLNRGGYVDHRAWGIEIVLFGRLFFFGELWER